MTNSKGDLKRKFWPAKLSTNVHFDTDLIPFKNYVSISVSVSLATIAAVVITILFSKLPPQVPLYYGLPEGEAQLAPALALILPSLVSIATSIVNIMTCFFIEDEFLKKVLILTSIGVTFFATITTIRIILLVGNI